MLPTVEPTKRLKLQLSLVSKRRILAVWTRSYKLQNVVLNYRSWTVLLLVEEGWTQ